ncbi:MAG: methyltransferase domain-containing protein, partial [Candidatus Aenigmatarchaeota archaeon]
MEEFPSGPNIPLVYQFDLLTDTNRLTDLKEAVEAVVEEGDTVADLGAGVGILSYLASPRADKVYAVENNQTVYEKGKEILAKENVDNVEFIHEDARAVTFPDEIDVVLC